MTNTLRVLASVLLAAFCSFAATPPSDFSITSIGDLPVEADSAAPLFSSPFDLVHGRLAAALASADVQLVQRTAGGLWIVQPEIALKFRPTSQNSLEWTIPLHVPLGQRAQIFAILVVAPLPAGPYAPSARLPGVRRQTEPLLVSCESFSRSHLRIVRIGNRVPAPNVPVPVSQFEPVQVVLDNVPEGAIIQIVCQPTDNDRRWASEQIEYANDSIVTSTAHFGRSVGIGGRKSIDIHSKFWVTAVATSRPLPTHGDSGITPQEWQRVIRFVKTVSPKVDAVRAILPGEIRVTVSKLGVSNNGVEWLSPGIARVEGTVSADQTYIPVSREIVTLLCRAPESKVWRVAAASYLGKNQSFFLMPAADILGANPSPVGICMAVITYRELDAGKPVSESDLRDQQVALSDEVHYRLAPARR